MQKTVIVHLHDAALSSVSWVFFNENSVTAGEAQVGNLHDLSAVCSGHKVALIIPSTLLTFTSVQLPATDRERMMRALPYAIEDRIIDDIDNMHFSINAWKNNQADISAISHQKMNSLIERFNSAGINLDYIIPDIFLIPFNDGEWTVLITNKYALVRTGQFSGFTTNDYNLQQVLTLNLSQITTSPKSINFIHKDDVESFTSSEFLPDFPSISISNTIYKKDYVTLFHDYFSENLSFNLLQGNYSKHEQIANIWRSWRPVAVFSGIMFLLYALSLSFNIHKLNKRITTVDNQINKIFKNTLPDVRKIINPKAQLQQRLAEIRKNSGNTKSGFLPLLAKSASSITKTKNIKLNSMVYKDGQLDMELVIDNFQSLDALKSKIESRGIVTEILSASADEKTVLGRIRLNEKK
jgi:general secretion pathway protein L